MGCRTGGKGAELRAPLFTVKLSAHLMLPVKTAFPEEMMLGQPPLSQLTAPLVASMLCGKCTVMRAVHYSRNSVSVGKKQPGLLRFTKQENTLK